MAAIEAIDASSGIRADDAGLGLAHPVSTSALLLAVALYIRLNLEESPVSQKMKSDGRGSKAPIRETFGSWSSIKGVLILLFGITQGSAPRRCRCRINSVSAFSVVSCPSSPPHW
jgi:hypothetical protein